MAVTKADGADFEAKNAGANLSSSVNLIAKLQSDDTVVLTAANTDLPFGVITEGATAGNPVTLQVQGMAKAVASTAINAGQRVMAGSDGKLAPWSGGSNYSIGVARSSVLADGEVVSFWFDRML